VGLVLVAALGVLQIHLVHRYHNPLAALFPIQVALLAVVGLFTSFLEEGMTRRII
jgi:hypothetical protein